MKKKNILWTVVIIGAVILVSRKSVEASAVVQKPSITPEDDRKAFYSIMANMLVRRGADAKTLILRQIKPEHGFDMLLYDMDTGMFSKTPEMNASMYSHSALEAELSSRAMVFSKEELNKFMLSRL